MLSSPPLCGRQAGCATQQKAQGQLGEKVVKTAAGRWKIYVVLPCLWLSLPHPHHPLPPLFLDDAQMTHQSLQSTGQGRFCVWSGEMEFCAAYDWSNCLIKSGIFIRVHGHWVVGILMWSWLDVHSNRLVQKEGLHGEQDKRRYEKKAGLWMTEKAPFFLYQHNWEDRVAEDFQWLVFSCVTGWATPRERTITSPVFIPSTFSSKQRFLSCAGPWQATVHPFNELDSLCRSRSKSSQLLWCNQNTFNKNNCNKIQRYEVH